MYRKPLIAIAILLAFLVTPRSFAAVTYEFRQISQSDFGRNSDGEVIGTGIIDGEKSRVELKAGGGHPPGTYIISRNDKQMLFIVDPVNKRFTEINAAQIASAMGSSKIQITNLKSNLTRMNDRPTVAGLPTEHHRLTISYDITVMFGALPLRQSVLTSIDKWVTTAFGELLDPTAGSTELCTGNADVDKLIAAEITKVRGFPLRQVTTIQTTSMDAEQNQRSKLKISPTRRQTSELLITRISPAVAEPWMFEVPAAFTKVEPSQGEGPALQMLTMQP